MKQLIQTKTKNLAAQKGEVETVHTQLVMNSPTAIINPRRMRKGYGSRFVCVCLSVTALAATYLVCMSKVRHHRVPCRLLKICIVWTSLKMFCLGDMA